MKSVFQLISWAALAATILPSCAYYAGSIGLEAAQWIMAIAIIPWFVFTPLWMGRETATLESEEVIH